MPEPTQPDLFHGAQYLWSSLLEECFYVLEIAQSDAWLWNRWSLFLWLCLFLCLFL